jgi:hypothetical protein
MRRLLILAAFPLILTACSPASPSPTTSAVPTASTASPVVASPSTAPADTAAPSPSGAPSALVFRVAQAGGFIAPSADLVALPSVSIYADGTIIVPGAASSADPAPAVPAIARETVDAGSLQKILDAAKATGLGDPKASFDGGPTPDAGVTLITIDLGGVARHLRIVSLGDASRDAGLDPAVVTARVKLRGFLASLDDMASLVGAGLVAPPAPFVADRVMLLVTPGSPATDASGGTSVAWPLATPLASFGATLATSGSGGGTNPGGLNGGGAGDARCGVVTGADLATLSPLFASATTLTPWTSAGDPFTVAVRPLLPDEAGCPSA